MVMRLDEQGRLYAEVECEAATRMTSPVRCSHCSRLYDLGAVTVTARYADCSVWKSPCCGRTVDDRGRGLKAFPDFERITRVCQE